MFAQSSLFQKAEWFYRDTDGGDRHGDPEPEPDPNPGGGGEEPTPLGSGIAILLGLSAGYVYFKRKGEE